MIGFLKSLSRNRLSLAGLVVITAVIFCSPSNTSITSP